MQHYATFVKQNPKTQRTNAYQSREVVDEGSAALTFSQQRLCRRSARLCSVMGVYIVEVPVCGM